MALLSVDASGIEPDALDRDASSIAFCFVAYSRFFFAVAAALASVFASVLASVDCASESRPVIETANATIDASSASWGCSLG